MYPLGRDILWPSVLLLPSGWPLVRCTPRQRHLVAKCVTTSIRLTFSQMYPQAETCCGQMCYYFSQVDLWSDVPPGRDILWPNVLLLQSGWPLVRCTRGETCCGQMCHYFSQVGLWSDVPPQAETSCSHVWYYFGSGWHVYWRARLVQAATVIPAPLAYIKVSAVQARLLYERPFTREGNYLVFICPTQINCSCFNLFIDNITE